ncbi:hypothetical protein EDD85DRAFT_932370 [Armillaria nabsnona]|nr:hypothetical protein EDD85DRAFT_932370 [Armillaria nabsnona]
MRMPNVRRADDSSERVVANRDEDGAKFTQTKKYYLHPDPEVGYEILLLVVFLLLLLRGAIVNRRVVVKEIPHLVDMADHQCVGINAGFQPDSDRSWIHEALITAEEEITLLNTPIAQLENKRDPLTLRATMCRSALAPIRGLLRVGQQLSVVSRKLLLLEEELIDVGIKGLLRSVDTGDNYSAKLSDLREDAGGCPKETHRKASGFVEAVVLLGFEVEIRARPGTTSVYP